MRRKEEREEALRLHEKGMGYKRISQTMGIPVGTIKSWWRRYSGVTAGPREPKIRRMRWNYQKKTPEDLQRLLMRAAREFHGEEVEIENCGRPVILVCGATGTGKGSDMLSMIISYKLGMNPFSGDVYAFCGKTRDRIKTIRWDGSGFQVMSRRRERGWYFWPSARHGETLTVPAMVMEYILRGGEDFPD